MDGYGNFLHYPAGTYTQQTRSEAGENELALLHLMHFWRVTLETKGKDRSKAQKKAYTDMMKANKEWQKTY